MYMFCKQTQSLNTFVYQKNAFVLRENANVLQANTTFLEETWYFCNRSQMFCERMQRSSGEKREKIHHTLNKREKMRHVLRIGSGVSVGSVSGEVWDVCPGLITHAPLNHPDRHYYQQTTPNKTAKPRRQWYAQHFPQSRTRINNHYRSQTKPQPEGHHYPQTQQHHDGSV